MAFKTGDIVQLKSGGPAMTVEQVVNRTVDAVWFFKGERRRTMFHEDTLMRLPSLNGGLVPAESADLYKKAQEQADQQPSF
jgi:uncharacterized protein YodC (DUF2158 family)